MMTLKDRLYEVTLNLEKVFQTRFEIWKLKLAAKSAEFISALIAALVVLFFGLMAFMVLSIGIGYWIGLHMNRISDGFFVLGGFYIVLGLLVFGLRKRLVKTSVQSYILHNLK